MELWEKVFNHPDFQEEPFVGSVYDYFRDQSYDQFHLQFDLHYVVMENPAANYSSGYIGNVPDDSGAGLLLTELLDLTKDDIDDWSVYDWNGDGYVDQIFILYAGKGQNDGGGAQSIWPHQWRLSEQSEDPWNREWGHPYQVAEGLLVDSYGAFAELTGRGTYGTFGTLCHEYSHCLGLPDIYYGSSTQVVGAWDLMDRGNTNAGGFCPPGYSAHERMLLGWVKPKEYEGTVTVDDMPPLSDAPEAGLLRNDGWPDEYYVIENRQQKGWDASLPGSGILIFHIDYDEAVWATGIPNSRELKRYSIIPANNKTSTATSISKDWAYPYQDNHELTDTSTPAAKLHHPNAEGILLMSKPITDMAVSADGLASLVINADPTAIRQVSAAGSHQVLYNIGPITIMRGADGTVFKVLRF